jgi:sugar lactone lactonase YvrE
MIVRVGRSGEVETIASGLTFPSGMALGPDGNLYVSNQGFALPSGSGQIVRVELPKEHW